MYCQSSNVGFVHCNMKNVSTLKSSSTESPKTPGGISRSLLTPCRRLGLSRNFKKSGSSPFQSPLSSNTELKQIKVKEGTKKRKQSLEETPQTPEINDDQGVPEVVQTPTRRVDLPRRKKSKILLVSMNKNGEDNDCQPSTDMNVSLVEKHCQSLFHSQDPGDLEQNINKGTASSPVHTLCIKSRSKKNISPLKDSTVIDLERNKSKTLLISINKNGEDNESQPSKDTNVSLVKKHCNKILFESQDLGDLEQNINNGTVSTPVHTYSLCVKSRSKNNISPSKESSIIDLEKENLHNYPTSTLEESKKNAKKQVKTKEKSPNNLTKECIVVIQKKIYKKELNEILQTPKLKEEKKQINKDTASQLLFDSDSDDMPLNCLNNKTTTKAVETHNINEEDDFTINKAKIAKPDCTNAGKTKGTKSIKSTKDKVTTKNVNTEPNKPPISQSSVDDDDEFFEKKKTILIRKSYNKIPKPQKAKSTGSITQKDIDDIKARIETKKKLLLARANMEDTKELKDLIKKWQKGCQEALMQLMDLMKDKIPDKQNMDYSEMLQTLKIPASLVGYDPDNDCFLTPDDESIILANVKV